MKVLVTGASGNVGRYVVKELHKMGEPVVAAGLDLNRLESLFAGQAEPVYFDFQDQSTYANALENADRVFIMRPPQLSDPKDLYPFIDALKKPELKLVSFLSLMGVEKNPIPPHHKIEKYIENAGVPYAHVRPGFFMQNLSGIHAAEIKEKNEIFVPAGRSKTSFIDAADIGLAVAVLLHEPDKYKNTAHTITGPEALDYFQAANTLSVVTGRKITYARPGFLKYRNYYIQQRGLDPGFVNVTVALYFMTRMGTAAKVNNDFYELTGRNPRTLREFVIANRDCFE